MTIEIPVQIKLDTSSTEIESKRAARSLDSIRKAAKGSATATKEQETAFFALQKATRFVDGPLGGIAARFETLNSVTTRGGKSLLALVAGVAAAGVAVTQFIRQAERFQVLTNQLKLVTDSTEELNAIQEQLLQVSFRSRTSLQATTDLYARLQRSTRDLNISQAELLTITETLAIATALSGTTAQSAAAALFQFGQGLAANRLSGQELNSVLEQTPRIGLALVDGLRELGEIDPVVRRTIEGFVELDKVSIATLRKLGEAGELTGDIIARAALTQFDDVVEELNKTAPTISQGIQAVSDSFTNLVGSFGQGVGVVTVLGEALFFLARNLETVGDVGVTIAALYGVRVVGGFFAATTASTALTASIVRAQAALLAYTAVTTSGTVATTALSVAVTGLNRVIALLGGPIGAVITVVGAAFLLLRDNTKSLEQVTAEYALTLLDVERKYVQANNASGDRAERLKIEAREQFLLNQEKAKALNLLAEERLQELQSERSRALRIIDRASQPGGISKLVDETKLIEDQLSAIRKSIFETNQLKRAIEDRNRVISQSPEQFEKDIASNIAAANATENNAKEVEKLRKELDSLTKSLRTPQEEYSATIERLEVLRKTVAKTPEDFEALRRAAVKAGEDLAEANRKSDPFAESLKDTAKEARRLRGELDSLTESLRTPQEEYDATIEKLELLRTTVAKTPEDFETLSRAAKRAGEDLRDSIAEGDPLTETLQDAADTIESSFKDTFKDIFSEGENAFENLGQRIKDIFVDLLAELAFQAIAQPIIVPVIQELGGFMGANNASVSSVTQGLGGSSGIDVGSLLNSAGGGSGFSLGSLTSSLDAFGASNLGLGQGASFIGPPAPAGLGVSTGGLPALSGLAGGALGGFGIGQANLFGGNQTGSTIGGTIGGIAGSFIPIPVVGTLIGSALGSAIGGLFGPGEGVVASEFTGVIGSDGFSRTSVGAKGDSTETAENVGSILEELVKQLQNIDGIEVGEITVRGGFNSNRGGGFFEVIGGASFGGVNLNDPDSVDRALGRLAVEIAKVGEVSESVAIALENIETAGRTAEEVLADLAFAASFDNLDFTPEQLTQYETALKALNQQFDIAVETARRLGLAESRVEEARQASLTDLREEFNQSISDRILAIDDPVQLALAQLDREFETLRTDATAIGGDLVELERLYGKERAEILARSLAEQTSATQQLLDSIQEIRDSLLLDENLGGLDRQGRAEEAQNQFDRLQESILAGEAGALNDLQGTINDFLTASLDFFGPTAEYFTRLQEVFDLLDIAENTIGGSNTSSGNGVEFSVDPVGAISNVTGTAASSSSSFLSEDYREQSARETEYLGQRIDAVTAKLSDIEDVLVLQRGLN